MYTSIQNKNFSYLIILVVIYFHHDCILLNLKLSYNFVDVGNQVSQLNSITLLYINQYKKKKKSFFFFPRKIKLNKVIHWSSVNATTQNKAQRFEQKECSKSRIELSGVRLSRPVAECNINLNPNRSHIIPLETLVEVSV